MNTKGEPPQGSCFPSSIHSSQKITSEHPTQSAVNATIRVGCLHISVASDDIPIATFIGSDIQGKFVSETSGQRKLLADFSDVNVRRFNCVYCL